MTDKLVTMSVIGSSPSSNWIESEPFLVKDEQWPSITVGGTNKQSYWFPTAFSHWADEERAAIEDVICSGHFTMGDEVAAFEREFADYHGMKHAIMVNSGSSANLLVIATLFELGKLKRGDKVIVPAIAWATTYAPLVQFGLDLVLADVDDSWNAGFEFCGECNWNGVKLVIGCSILGNPAYLKEWKTNAGIFDAIFVEDNCESLGAMHYKPIGVAQRCGTFGLMNTFSLFYSHQISAIEGGVILTNDDDCAIICKMLRAHGWSRDIEKPKSFDDEYSFKLFGYNLRPLELHAAIARCQLRKLPEFIKQRQANWVRFRKWTDHLPITHPTINGDPSPFGLQFTVKDQETRARLVTALRANGIDCRLPTGGSFRLHEYSKLNPAWRAQETPNADSIHRWGLFLGNAPFPLEDKITKAVEVIQEVL